MMTILVIINSLILIYTNYDFTLGKGYRIYYTIQNEVVVLLLNAGDKSKQSKDIELAKTYLKDIKDN